MGARRFRPQKRISWSQWAALEALESRTLLSAVGTPSLVVTVPGPIPASGVAGATVNDRIEVNIANEGTGKFSGRTAITLYASPDGDFNNADAQLGKLTVSLIIPAGTSKNVFIHVGTVPKNLAGDYFVLANAVAPTVTVAGVSATALDVVSAFIDLSNAVIAVPAVSRPGGRINVTLDVTNLGNVTAVGTLATNFGLSPSSNGSNPFNLATLSHHISIKPDASEKLLLSVPVPLGSPSGEQFIVAVADPGDVFNDSKLGNNSAISASPVNLT